MTQPDLDDVLRIDISGGVVKVWHARSARNDEEAEAILAAIDRALETSGIDLLMIDSRDADRTPPEVQARIWTWLTNSSRIRKVATLVQSAELATNVRATGVGHGVLIKAFHDEDEARRWLTTPERPGWA